MGRSEKPLPQSDSPLIALAAYLRELRILGGWAYDDMAGAVTTTASALSKAAAGRVLPRLDTVRDYVRACRGNDGDLARAERLWREATRHARGKSTTEKPSPAKVHTPQQFADAITTLLEEADVIGRRAIEDATTALGRRIPRSTLSRWLCQGAPVMPAEALETLLVVCKVPAGQHMAWAQARTRAALVDAGLRAAPVSAKTTEPPAIGQDEETAESAVAAAAVLPLLTVVPSLDLRSRFEPDQAASTGHLPGFAVPAVVTRSEPLDQAGVTHVTDITPRTAIAGGRSEATPEQLMNELRALCRGQGVQAPGIDKQVGPALREVCRIIASDDPQAVRVKISRWVIGIVDHFPDELRLAVLVPLGMHDDAQSRFLSDRVDWLAKVQARGPRTIRRRVEAGLTRLVEAGLARTFTPPQANHQEIWHVKNFHALLRLDGEVPTCIEWVTVHAHQSGLSEITWSSTMSPISNNDLASDLEVLVLHGVQLVATERPSPRRFLLRLRFPRPLQAGETHQFSVEVRVLKGQSIYPQYVFWPEDHCDHFRLVARFPPEAPPTALWQVDDLFHRDIDAVPEDGNLLTVNEVGEVDVEFHPRIGRGYGLLWWPGDEGLPVAPAQRRPVPVPVEGGAKPERRTG